MKLDNLHNMKYKVKNLHNVETKDIKLVIQYKIRFRELVI